MEVLMVIGEVTAERLVAVAASTPPGCFVEVGVYRGGSARRLLEVADSQSRQLYAYDTFTGLPYKADIDPMVVGDFKDTDYEAVCAVLPGATVVRGLFPGSAVSMPPVAFAHIDCDQYQAVKESAKYLEPLMVPGGILWFDDYGCLAGANAAVDALYSGRIEFDQVCGKAFVRCGV